MRVLNDAVWPHIYAAICIIIQLKVMFWKLFTMRGGSSFSVRGGGGGVNLNLTKISFYCEGVVLQQFSHTI